MKLFKTLGATLALTLFVAGCGGGNTLTNKTCTTNCTPGGGQTVASVGVTASAASIAADGSTTSTITATALDANNVAVPQVAITFAATTGGVLTVVSGTTDTSGRATATVAAATGAAVGTTVTVNATAGTVRGSASVTIVQIQQTLSLTTSLPLIPSDSSKGATITALMRDANNNVLPGIAVNFSPDSGAITKTQTLLGGAASPVVIAGTTDANGVATAVLTAGNDPTNRVITVTVTAGSAPPATIQVSVGGTLLALSGQASLVAGNSSTYTALLTDASGAGIAGKTVTFSSAKGNTLSATTATTDAGGHATVKLTASVAGTDTLTAAALGLTAPETILVSSESFTITLVAPPNQNPPLPLVPLSSIPPATLPVVVQVLWTSSGTPKANAAVTFSTTRGTILSATSPWAALANPTVNTDATGTATVAIASSLAGPAIISASGSGVSAQVPVTFVAQTPAGIAVQASPATIPINGTSTISAIVRDAQNNLVEGATVDFNLTVDPTGGSLSTATATTDVQGRAQTIYTATATTSAANGITVTASVPGTTVTGSTSLSVGGQTVFLSLGTGNKISAPNTAQYEQDWAVQALDSHGAALANAPVTATVLPLYYYKGFRNWTGTVWGTVNSIPGCAFPALCTDPSQYAPVNYIYVPNGAQCPNEDIGWTGIYVASEDYNNNGKLDPGNVASVQPSTGGVTDSTGTLLLHVTWPQDHAYYVGVRLSVTATVQGTQHSTSADFVLPGLAADFNQQTTEPPGPFSPYGFENSSVNDCSNPK